MTTLLTPGPWEAIKMDYEGHASAAWYIYARNGLDQRSPSVAHVKKSTLQPMEANAHLIAAAPELLAIAQAATNNLPEGHQKQAWLAVVAKATGAAV